MRDFINKLGNIFMKPLLRSPLHFFASALVTVRLRGRDISGVAQTITDETTIMAAFTRMHPKIVTAQAPDFAASTVMVQIGLREAVERYMLSHS